MSTKNYAEQIAWLQDVSTLHRSVDILYVVDGYQVTVVWDDHPISDSFHGATVAEAISKAMAGFDLNVRHPYQDRDIYGHERQMVAAVAAEREACAKLCEDQDTGQGLLHDKAVIECAAAIRARGTP